MDDLKKTHLDEAEKLKEQHALELEQRSVFSSQEAAKEHEKELERVREELKKDHEEAIEALKMQQEEEMKKLSENGHDSDCDSEEAISDVQTVKSVKSKSSKTTLHTAQQSLMAESGELLVRLKKELQKLRSQNQHLRKDMNTMKGSNKCLMDANGSLGKTCEQLNLHGQKMNKTNAKLKAQIVKTDALLDAERDKVQMLTTAQMETKAELELKHESYVEEAHSRNEYFKVLVKISEQIQERCRDYRLAEDILGMTDEVLNEA